MSNVGLKGIHEVEHGLVDIMAPIESHRVRLQNPSITKAGGYDAHISHLPGQATM